MLRQRVCELVACDCRSRSEKQFTVAIVLLPVWMGETKSVWLPGCHAKARLIITAPLGPQTQKQEVSRRQRKLLVFWWPLPWFSDFSHNTVRCLAWERTRLSYWSLEKRVFFNDNREQADFISISCPLQHNI